MEFGYSHKSDIVTNSSRKNWAGGLGYEPGVAATWVEDTFSEDSDSSSECKLMLGGERMEPRQTATTVSLRSQKRLQPMKALQTRLNPTNASTVVQKQS